MSDPTPSTLGSLSRPLLTEDANLQAGLRRIAQSGADLLSKCAGASVTIIEHDLPFTVAATNETALILDESQYEVDDGPCLTAAREIQTIRIDNTTSDGRWPNYVTAARDIGVGSSLSLPMRIADESYCGGLNLYGLEPMSFSETDEQLAHAFADQASVMVANTQAYCSAFEMTKNLTIAMESRGNIEQAKGILMEAHRIDDAAAFNLLHDRSQAENRELRDIAAEIVAYTIRGVDSSVEREGAVSRHVAAMTTDLPFELGRVWRAKLTTSPFSTIRIIGASDRRFAWMVEVPDGRRLTMTAEHIRREYSPSP